MKKHEIHGDYDAIFSLGDLCLTSIQLKKHGLRPYSGVLDWVASKELKTVNRLLKNRFAGFMDFENLRVIGYAGEDFICVSDDGHNIVSNHDFEVGKNTLHYLGSYSEVKEKYARRIGRFLERMENAKNILFVRTEGSFEDILELQTVLSNLVQHDYRILLINHEPVSGIVKKNWPLEKVYAVDLPNKDIWEGNHHLWDELLEGVRLVD
ncbi:DUF1796 domain-containing protein [Filibacter tadaridae]|uniref:Papain-like cysteine peptidase (DUF1796) n=1 Tax=Filibacter tadaridae TaxID=2483811 RepID=A0A3P5X0I4_9BACL|nr:DUF1796 family putative cysteine peptidase [Filibacter tadaridae]VDC28894.1 hypothetical protein FILTAD_01890 [Filibacter tadaridae]